MRILFVASECVPFAKAGGLGDVVGALPKALFDLGHDVRVLLPKYGHLSLSGFERLPQSMGVPMGFGTAWCAVYEGKIPGSEVPVYLLEHDAAFGAPQIYGDEAGTVWGGVKFGILSRAGFELGRWLDWRPEVMHLHDWPTAWAAVMANGVEASAYPELATVLTIHNFAHQPKFPEEVLDHIGLGREFFKPDGLEDFGDVNPFKGGLYHATMLTTVSPRYAREIRTPELGNGLDGVAEFRAGDLVGILNGIDEDVWNPATDTYIPANFTPDDLSGKKICKQALAREMHLDQEEGPLLGAVSRMTWQKGLDVIAEAIERILATGARFALLGSGDPGLQDHFRFLAERHRGRFAVRVGYDEGLAHLIEAGSDFFLMPSRFEPCGLNQLYSQRYGTLPIVHATGGLEDTVDQADPGRGTGTGFKFWAMHADALANTVRWATEMYRHQPELFRTMQKQSMTKNMGWDVAAGGYVEVYRWAMERKGVAS